MLVVGLTGGIGSGKSTVAELFAEKNVPIIDTDILAREVTAPKQPVLKKMVEIFGPTILLPDGSLDRTTLRKLVFSEPALRQQLETLLHPLIREKVRDSIQTIAAPYCIVIIPLLFETAPNPLIQRILVVDTPEELQLSRTSLRDNISIQDVTVILKTQAERHTRLKGADDIIVNDGIYEDLIPQVNKMHALYLSISQSKTPG